MNKLVKNVINDLKRCVNLWNVRDRHIINCMELLEYDMVIDGDSLDEMGDFPTGDFVIVLGNKDGAAVNITYSNARLANVNIVDLVAFEKLSISVFNNYVAVCIDECSSSKKKSIRYTVRIDEEKCRL